MPDIFSEISNKILTRKALSVVEAIRQNILEAFFLPNNHEKLSLITTEATFSSLTGFSSSPKVFNNKPVNKLVFSFLALTSGIASTISSKKMVKKTNPDMKTGMVVFFEDIDLGLGVKIAGLVFSTMAKLQAIVLALECTFPFNLVQIFSDSQSALDACKSELDLIKSHLEVLDNMCANVFAKTACFSNWFFSYCFADCYIKAGDGIVFANSKHFVGSGSQILVDSLHIDIDWFRLFLIRSIAKACTYFIKALHHQLSVAICKHLYAKDYPSVVCLFCGNIEVLDHVFSCLFNSDVLISGLSCSVLCVSQYLSFCFSNVAVCVTLSKRFVFNNWYWESLSIFKNSKIAGKTIVNFVCRFGLVFRDKIWLAHVKYWAFMKKNRLILHDESVLVLVSELFSVFSAGVVKLLSIVDAISVGFGFHNSYQFFSGLDSVILVCIKA
ncbi:hypothetical protein G9A89_010561 [Geosiphon pyriformis]|nr:hypothetical protein G9A89_010561 [Geosiphon pyriformis]